MDGKKNDQKRTKRSKNVNTKDITDTKGRNIEDKAIKKQTKGIETEGVEMKKQRLFVILKKKDIANKRHHIGNLEKIQA